MCMHMHNILNHFEHYNSDERSEFANAIFKNLCTLYKGDFNNVIFLNEASKMVKHLEEYVRNIYELIDEEIPMMAYIHVLKSGTKGYDIWEQYDQSEALKIIENYCHQFYK